MALDNLRRRLSRPARPLALAQQPSPIQPPTELHIFQATTQVFLMRVTLDASYETDGIFKAAHGRLIEAAEAIFQLSEGRKLVILHSPLLRAIRTAQFIENYLGDRLSIETRAAPSLDIRSTDDPMLLGYQLCSRQPDHAYLLVTHEWNILRALESAGQKAWLGLVGYGSVFRLDPSTGEYVMLQRGIQSSS